MVAKISRYPLYVNTRDTIGIIADKTNKILLLGYWNNKIFLISMKKYKKAAVLNPSR